MTRLIKHTIEELRHPWPEDCYVQGGNHGFVFVQGGENYTTAFVEAFPREPKTFIRGEGTNLQESEDRAWEQYQRYLTCSGHEFEAKSWRNGAGVCKHCGLFASNVFSAEELGLYCHACNAPTFYMRVSGLVYCENHEAEGRRERAIQRVTGTIDESPLETLLALVVDDDKEER